MLTHEGVKCFKETVSLFVKNSTYELCLRNESVKSLILTIAEVSMAKGKGTLLYKLIYSKDTLE